jgi:hypothetical protein
MHNAMLSTYSFPDFWEGLRVITGDEEFEIQLGASDFQGYRDGWVNDIYFGRKDAYTINISTPRFGPSKGTIRLKSSDPFEVVSIDFNGYDEEDLVRVANAVVKIREYGQRKTDRGLLQGPLQPGADVTTFEG